MKIISTINMDNGISYNAKGDLISGGDYYLYVNSNVSKDFAFELIFYNTGAYQGYAQGDPSLGPTVGTTPGGEDSTTGN